MISVCGLTIAVFGAIFGYLKLARSERVAFLEAEVQALRVEVADYQARHSACEKENAQLRRSLLERETEKIQLLSKIASLQETLIQRGGS